MYESTRPGSGQAWAVQPDQLCLIRRRLWLMHRRWVGSQEPTTAFDNIIEGLSQLNFVVSPQQYAALKDGGYATLDEAIELLVERAPVDEVETAIRPDSVMTRSGTECTRAVTRQDRE